MRNPAKFKARRGERGAALVEAIIVIAVFIIAFTGLVYFHDLYISKVKTSRLARVATLHHAIDGCKGNVGAELGLVGGNSNLPGGFLSNDVQYGQPVGTNLSSVAQSAVGGQGGVSSSLGAKIVHITNDGAAAGRGGGAFYSSPTNTTSWVGCSDPVDENQFGDIIPRVTSAIQF
jgi:hypothetical protein